MNSFEFESSCNLCTLPISPLGCDITSSLIDSFLGPNKSLKCVVNGTESSFVCCPVAALQAVSLKEPIACVIEQTLQAHHEYYGCGTSSLLAMWYFWNQQFKVLLDKGYQASDISNVSRKALDYIVSCLSSIMIPINTLLDLVNDEIQMKSHHVRSISSCCQPESHVCESQLMSTSRKTNYSNYGKGRHFISEKKVPFKATFKSRHYSLVTAPEELKLPENAIGTSLDVGHDNVNSKFILSKKSCDTLFSFVSRLCHNENDFSKVLVEVWKKQIEISKSLVFCPEYISLCSVVGPLCSAMVPNGLLLKVTKNFIFPNAVKSHKALLVNGDITMEFVHFGFAPSAHVKVEKSENQLFVTKFSAWKKECLSILEKLQISLLLVRGCVDSEIVDFCSCNCISLISNIPWREFQVLMSLWQSPPPTYLLDCTEKDVCSNITFKLWQNENLRSVDMDEYVLISQSVSNQCGPQTIVLCHPSSAVLQLHCHQFWHDASRLSLATKAVGLLPGSVKTEMWCVQELKPLASSARESEKEIIAAVADGFSSFCAVVLKKMSVDEDTPDVWDEMDSKVQAWNSALALSFISLNCDLMILNGCNETATCKAVENSREYVGHL